MRVDEAEELKPGSEKASWQLAPEILKEPEVQKSEPLSPP